MIFVGLIAKINDFKPLAPKDLVQTGRKRYIHDGMFYVSDDPFYPSVRKYFFILHSHARN